MFPENSRDRGQRFSFVQQFMDDLSSNSETETDLDVIIEAAVTNDNSDDDLI